jgi:sarcosine oxidase subunit beta
MSKHADCVIVGGGIIGCGAAYYLSKLGAKRVLLVEREKFLATGATAKSAAAVRHLFTTPINIRLSMRSLDVFERFEEEFDTDPVLVQNGYMFAAPDDAQWEILQKNTAIQKTQGVRVELVEPREILKIVPQLNVEDVLGGSFGPRDGTIDPNSVTMGYAQRARAQGVEFLMETEATDVRVEGGRVRGVETDKGRIEAPLLIDASGPHLAVLAGKIGVEVPALPYRRMLATTERFDKITKTLPLTIDMATGWYCRRETEGVMMGRANKKEISSFDETVDWRWIEKMIEAGVHRVPILEEAQISKAWAGLYTVTPDRHPIVGPLPGVEGFYLLGGFSGRGIMHSPAACEALAQRILLGKSDLDIRPLRFERFAEGDLQVETAVI